MSVQSSRSFARFGSNLIGRVDQLCEVVWKTQRVKVTSDRLDFDRGREYPLSRFLPLRFLEDRLVFGTGGTDGLGGDPPRLCCIFPAEVDELDAKDLLMDN